jgi:nickel/cobalt exporter
MAPRGSPAFSLIGYGLVALAGFIMLIQSLRPTSVGVHPHILTMGIGLLPCPLTIMVLGFAWTQSTPGMVAVVLVSLACGIALTIGTVALSAIAARRIFDEAFLGNMLRLERPARYVQGVAATAVICVAAYSMWRSI